MSSKKTVKPGSARKAIQETVNVEVIAEGGLGMHKKGAVIPMSKSTADACIKNKVVKLSK